MAFSMSSVPSTLGASASSPKIDGGAELKQIQPENIGFKGLNGDKKARVLQNQWPADALPPSYAAVLSIASASGLYAAAGPDAVVIGKTQDVRDRIYDKEGDTVRSCPPLHTIPNPRPVHVAFAANESRLVVAEQESAEIVAYQTAALMAKKSDVAVRLPTQAPVRVLVPNPDPAQAQLFALVNTHAQLLVADLQQNTFVQGPTGPVLAENVTCVTWSNKGKQLLAGRADCTAVQLKLDGTVAATFPKLPTETDTPRQLAQIAWLENDVFFLIYTAAAPVDAFQVESDYYLVHTDKNRTTLTYQKIDMDPFYPVKDRVPAHFLTSRLRNYPPTLSEVLFIASTVAADVVMVTKSTKALAPAEHPVDNAYTLTMPNDDLRRAALPMSQERPDEDSACIGMAIDLSDTFPVVKPIPNDADVEDSSVPLPELVVLDHEGMLIYWAFIYDDGIRSKQTYPSMEEVQKSKSALQSPGLAPRDSPSIVQTGAPSKPTSAEPQSEPSQSSAFGTSSGFGQSNPIGQDSKPAWTSSGFSSNTPSAQGPAFGQPATFGSTPTLGQSNKPAFGAPGFGQPGFGSKPAFGQPNSPFASQSSQSSPFASKSTSSSSPFAAAGSKPGSGFGSFANQTGFGGREPTMPGSTSGFGRGGGFGADSKPFSPFASAGQPTGHPAFGKATPIGSSAFSGDSPFGQTKGFKLESSFQKDETSKDDDSDDKPGSDRAFGLGSGLGNLLGATTQRPPMSPSKEEEMGDNDDEGSTTEVETSRKPQKTPPSTLTEPKSNTTPHVSTLFGNRHASTTPQAQPASSTGTGWGFGHLPSTTPKDTPGAHTSIFGTQPVSKESPALVQKSEPNRPFSFTTISNQSSDVDKVKSLSSDDEEVEPEKVPEAPLPPDPFSKPGYQAGDTSASSLNSMAKEADDAPLPPDFIPANKTASQSVRTQDSEIPSEFLSDDFEGSGDDVTGDVSPVEEKLPNVGDQVETSPESSFGQGTDRSNVTSPAGETSMNVKANQSKPSSRPLFGEFGGTQGPIFAPPRPQQSPRSPSPMRKPPRQGMLSRSPERSFSAPAQPRSMISQRKFELQHSPFAAEAARVEQQEAHKARLQRECEQQAREEAEKAELRPLEDDEDALLREELAKATQPSEHLDPFIAIQPGKALQEWDVGRNDVPSQIEILYQDINSMIVTLGINAKSLSAYMMHQTGQEPNAAWPNVLVSDTPMDALNEEWLLGDIDRLPEGQRAIADVLGNLEVKDVMQKLEECHRLLTTDIGDLRARLTALRRSTHARSQPEDNQHAALSAEQASIQQDLRKSFAAVLRDLATLEDDLIVLRARIADVAPSKTSEKQSMFGWMSGAQKRPSVEAVMATVSKMTSMAEKRSADVDVLEAQLKKLHMTEVNGHHAPSTPAHRMSRTRVATPGSAASSVYHTPDSRGRTSLRGTPAKGDQVVVSLEDKEKWQAKSRRKKELSDMLKRILQDKQSKAAV